MNRLSSLVVLLAIVSVAGACTSESAPSTTTTRAPVTTLTSTTTTVGETSTSSTLPPIRQLSPPEYAIVERTEVEGNGDEVVVLLDPSSYDSLTDIDLYDLIAEVVELFPPITIMHVVDEPSAANVVADPEAGPDDIAAVSSHYLARLENGFRVVYLGPFASSGSAVLGS